MPQQQSRTLPISVIFPTYNCGDRILKHIKASADWLQHVDELIIVDSYSKDGTIDIITEALAGHDFQILQHPRGLYRSWNHGVNAARNEYIYFSTIGDIISRDGLKKLFDAAKTLKADLVVSPPSFISEDSATPLPEAEWPIHTLIREFKIQQVTTLPPRLIYDCVLIFMEQALLGSSASNLYRRDTLIQHPFSDDFFSAGDSQWLINNNFKVKLAIVPEPVATFLFHQKDWSFDRSDSQDGQWLRRTFAYCAFNMSLDHSPTFHPEVVRLIREIIKFAIGEPERAPQQKILSVKSVTQQIEQIDPDTEKYNFTIQAMLTRSNYLILRQTDRRYKESLGILRFMWPRALINRKHKRQSKKDLSGLLHYIKRSWANTDIEV